MIDDGITITQQLHVEMTMRQRLPIDQNLRHLRRQTARYERDRPHLQRAPDHQQQVALVLVLRHRLVERVGQPLPEEDYVRLHDPRGDQLLEVPRLARADRLCVRPAPLAHGDLLREHGLPDLVRCDLVAALRARCGREGAVTLDDAVDLRDALQGVDVLGVVAEELPVTLQELYEPKKFILYRNV